MNDFEIINECIATSQISIAQKWRARQRLGKMIDALKEIGDPRIDLPGGTCAKIAREALREDS